MKISGDERDHADLLVEARLQGVAVTVVPAANDATLKQPLDVIQIDEDGEEEDRAGHNDEDEAKIGDWRRSQGGRQEWRWGFKQEQ